VRVRHSKIVAYRIKLLELFRSLCWSEPRELHLAVASPYIFPERAAFGYLQCTPCGSLDRSELTVYLLLRRYNLVVLRKAPHAEGRSIPRKIPHSGRRTGKPACGGKLDRGLQLSFGNITLVFWRDSSRGPADVTVLA
jgi:hypothetical protein